METKKKIVNVVKGITILVAGVAAVSVTGAVIKNIVPVEGLSRYNKLMLAIGTALIGGIVAEASGNYAAGIVDAIDDSIDKAIEMVRVSDMTIEELEREYPDPLEIKE